MWKRLRAKEVADRRVAEAPAPVDQGAVAVAAAQLTENTSIIAANRRLVRELTEALAELELGPEGIWAQHDSVEPLRDSVLAREDQLEQLKSSLADVMKVTDTFLKSGAASERELRRARFGELLFQASAREHTSVQSLKIGSIFLAVLRQSLGFWSCLFLNFPEFS